MNKADISGRVAARLRLRKAEADAAVDTVFEAIGESLAREGDAVVGSLERSVRDDGSRRLEGSARAAPARSGFDCDARRPG